MCVNDLFITHDACDNKISMLQLKSVMVITLNLQYIHFVTQHAFDLIKIGLMILIKNVPKNISFLVRLAIIIMVAWWIIGN